MAAGHIHAAHSQTMNTPLISFQDSDRIGRVAGVDTSRVIITAEDHSLLTRSGVGQLVAVRGATQQEFLIGMVERVTRTLGETLLWDKSEAGGEVPASTEPEDAMRVVLIGTYRTVDGDKSDVFKRGADTFPQIDRDCFLIAGGNLQGLMNLLIREVLADERMDSGHFVVDRSAAAVAHGDRFFQRHASIFGSTGCGKSWAVA